MRGGPLGVRDLELARAIGWLTYKARRSEGAAHRWNRPAGAHNVELDQLSTAAEILAARATGIDDDDFLTWSAPRKSGDIAPGHQVRLTQRANGDLLLHPEDEDAHVFYLVAGSTFETLTVVGRLRAVLGKRREFWRELQPGRPCFVVPRGLLREVRPLDGFPRFTAVLPWRNEAELALELRRIFAP